MSKRNAQKRISRTQLYPLALNPSGSPSSWVSLKYEKSSGNNVDYLVIQKPKSKISCKQVFLSLFRHAIVWNAFITLAILIGYFTTTTIYVYYPANTSSPFDWRFYVTSLFDIIYILDAISSIIIWIIAKTQTSNTRRNICWILTDFLLALPYSTIYLLLYHEAKSDLFLLLRLVTYIRLYTIILFFNSWEKLILNHRMMVFYIKFTSYFLILTHTFACLWYMSPKFTDKHASTWVKIAGNAPSYSNTISHWYLLTSYFSIDLITQTGFGDYFPGNLFEQSIAALAMCVGLFIWSYYISCSIILRMRRKYGRYKIQKELSTILNHLKFMEADNEIVRNCIEYYEVLWTQQNGTLSTNKLEDLPDMIGVHMNQKCYSFVLKHSIIFNDKPASFLRNVCSYIKHEFYLPGQEIYTQDRAKEKMIIVKSGKVQILSEEDNETAVISLETGTCLGEASLIINVPSKVSVKAADFTEVYAIYTKDFCKIITNYPDFYNDIRKAIYTRIGKKLVAFSKSQTNWKDLKQLLRDRANIAKISNPIITRYTSLYKISSEPEEDNTKSLREEKKFKWIRNEHSTAVLLWEVFIVACAINVCIFHPYFVTFKRSFPPWYETIANFVHVIFVLDIYFLLTTSVTTCGKKIKTLKGILDYRMDTSVFYMDVFACFYLEVYSILTEDETRFHYLLKLNRILKIARVTSLCDRLESGLTANWIKIACVKYATFLFFFLYWCGLLMYAATCFYPACVVDGWFIVKLRKNEAYRGLVANTFGRFLISVYYSLSSTLAVGVGDILPANVQDVVLTIFVIILGKFLFGYYAAEFSSLLALNMLSRNKFDELTSAVQFYAGKRSIPHKLEKRITTYFNLQWLHNEATTILNEKSPLSNLPPYLSYNILAAEKLATLKKFVVFDDLDTQFLDHLVRRSKTALIGPNEIVTYFGSINREMYFICRGLCLKQTENNTYETIGPGSCVGFSSLLFGLPSLNNVCTLTHCILIYIDVRTFNSALQRTPLLYRTVYRTRQLILAKYQSNYEVKMIENPHYTRRKKKLKLKYRKLNERMIKNKSFVNAYKYCMSNKESYSKLSNTTGKICFLKYLLMPISILPYGPFMKVWYGIRVIIALTLYFLIPMEYLLSPYMRELHYFRFTLEILVYIDMYLRCHVAYYGDNNQLIIHPWRTAEHYLRVQFLLDLFIWFPYPLVIMLSYHHTEGHSEYSHSLSPHFFHCFGHLIKVLDVYKVFVALHYVGIKWNRYCLLRLIKYLLSTITLAHSWTMVLLISTCKYLHVDDASLYFEMDDSSSIPGVIIVSSGELNMYCTEDSWLNRSHHGNYSTVSQIYLTGFYFVVQSMNAVGFGDIFAENILEFVVVILITVTGLLFYGYLLTDIICHATSPKHSLLIFEAKFLHLINYMKQERVDHYLRRRVQEYIQYKWNRTKNFYIHNLLHKTNSTLHEDAILYLYENTLKHIPMFENLDHSFFRVIGKELKEEYYMEGDTVVHVNDILQDIYIVHRGTVEVSSPHNMIPVIMGNGGVFGNVFEREISLSSITVRAVKNVDVLCLNVKSFRSILKDYPIVQKKLTIVARQDQQKHYAIPNSFVDEGNVYLNPNTYWSTKRNKKKSFLSNCRESLNPDSHSFTAFNCFLLLTAYCNYLLTTYQFCFQHYCNALLTSAVIIDVVFLLRFCLEINAPQSNLPDFMTSRSFMAKCMQRKWRRTLDFLANLPIGYSILFVPFISNDNANFYFSIWRLFTLLRLYYVFQLFLVHKEKLMVRRFVLELSIFIVFSTAFWHLLACIWYLSICPWKNCTNTSWISPQLTDAPEELYVISLYLVLSTVTCTGLGDITPETSKQMFVIVLYMMIAKIFLGYFIAQLIRTLQCGNMWLMKYETIMEHLKSYYRNMGAYESQIRYLNKYMSELWKKKNGLQKYELLTELPPTLRSELMTSIYGKLVKDSYIFCRAERDFVRQLCLHLKHRTYFPGDYVVRDGDVDSCMYFIHRGDVQILTVAQTVNETVHEVLHKDEVFGIVQGLFKEIPHHFSFRASTVVDLAVLRLEEWEHLLEFFPRSKDVIYQRVEDIYYTI